MKKEGLDRWLPWISTCLSIIVILFVTVKLVHSGEDLRALVQIVHDRMTWDAALLLVLLMPLNWFIEIAKWHFLTNKFKSVSWKKATEGVLGGLALGFITPHALGDYAGRLAVLGQDRNIEMASMIFLSRAAQMIATLAFGIWGISNHDSMPALANWFLIPAGLFLILLFLILNATLKRWNLYNRIKQAFLVPGFGEIIYIVMLAFLRYAIFGFQLVLALHVLAAIPWMQAAAGTTWIFLIKSVAPVFNFLSDLGIREASAILYFEPSGVALAPVVSATLLIWCINILLPTLTGAVIFLVRKKNE